MKHFRVLVFGPRIGGGGTSDERAGEGKDPDFGDDRTLSWAADV
jgi:hypothetical protein